MKDKAALTFDHHSCVWFTHADAADNPRDAALTSIAKPTEKKPKTFPFVLFGVKR